MSEWLRRFRAAWYGLTSRENDPSRRYWTKRALRHGERSVLNLGHKAAEGDAVTAQQREKLFPVLRSLLRGDEQVVLDYGCGPGRFTPALAEVIHGRAVGVDPTEPLIALAPRAKDVEYHVLSGERIPLPDNSADVLWLCLVLCCIVDDAELDLAVAELGRVLKPGGLVFVVENTSARPDLPHIRFRTVERYTSLFPWAELRPVDGYLDLGEQISVLAGRAR